MLQKVAVLLDGGYLLWELRDIIRREATAQEIIKVAHACFEPDTEQLFRIYFYDCLPFAGSSKHPVSGELVDFSEAAAYKYRSSLYRELALASGFAFRKGQLKFRHWKIKNSELQRIIKNGVPVEQWKLLPDFQQKGVDIKIGLDIAWLSSKRIVDKIILFTGDTDFVPAMKFARREGVQVLTAAFKNSIPIELKEHADGFRVLAPADCGLGHQVPGALA